MLTTMTSLFGFAAVQELFEDPNLRRATITLPPPQDPKQIEEKKIKIIMKTQMN